MKGKDELGLENAAEILKGVVIPPRPQLLMDIHDVYPNISKIAELIETDQGVSAGVLKAISSPLFGVRKKQLSIKRAVLMLGVTNVLTIVNGLLLRSALSNKLKAEDFKEYWSASTDTAIVCASVTRQLNLDNPECSYMMGLFHNCGMPLLMKKFEDYSEVLRQGYQFNQNSVVKPEEALYGTNHATVGYMVGKYWRLPDEICKVIRDHHDMKLLKFGTVKDSEMMLLLSILKMAEHIVKLPLRLGQQKTDFEWEFIQNNLLDFIGINKSRFEEVYTQALDDLSEYGTHGVKVVDDQE